MTGPHHEALLEERGELAGRVDNGEEALKVVPYCAWGKDVRVRIYDERQATILPDLRARLGPALESSRQWRRVLKTKVFPARLDKAHLILVFC